MAQPDAQVAFLNTDLNNNIDNFYIRYPNERFHASIKPYVFYGIKEADDSAFHVYNYRIKNQFLYNAIQDDPGRRNHFFAQFLPQIDTRVGYDVLQAKVLTEMSGGMYARLDVNNDFSADATFIGGQVMLPNFTDTIVSEYKIVPGMGLAYGGSGKYSFTNFTGHLSYSPIRVLNFQIGQDKMFIGDGYRSLLLSDVATNYPYFKSTLNIWKIQYSVWYSWLRDIYGTGGVRADFRNKYTTSHYLSFNPLPGLNISFYENEVWQGTDTNRHRGFDPNYLNPVIFYRPVEYALGSGDNAHMGLCFSYRFLDQFKLYSQVVIDEFNFAEIKQGRRWWANKQGVQFGLRVIDLGLKNLSAQVEYNMVRPFTYSHGSPQQNYSHFNQPLAHPFGANFSEGLGMISYKRNHWQLDLSGIVATIGKDTVGSKYSVGQNIFLTYTLHGKDYGHNLLQGNKHHFLQGEIKFSYFIIPGLNLRLEAGYIQRYVRSDFGYVNQTPYIYLGLRTSMHNFYRDY
jgi:hypothetical protein